MSVLTNCMNSKTCLRIRRNETLQRTVRRMNKSPNGIFSPIPVLFAFLAWVLSITSSCVCGFVARSVSVGGDPPRPLEEGEDLFLQSHGMGFYGFSSGGTCYSYDIDGSSPSLDGSFSAASAFATITDLFGGMVTVILLLGTVFPIIPKYYEYLGYFTLLVCLLDGCTLMMLGSSVCASNFFNYVVSDIQFQDFTSASCSLGTGAILALMAAILWLVSALLILQTPLASRKREPNPYRLGGVGIVPPPGGAESTDGGEGDEGFEEEMDEQALARKAENDRRYRELMGDEISAASGEPAFRPPVKNRLSMVQEDEDEPMADSPGRQSIIDVDQDMDHSETRSQYGDDIEDDYRYGDGDALVADVTPVAPSRQRAGEDAYGGSQSDEYHSLADSEVV